MARRQTLYLSDEAERLLGAPDNLSGRVSTMLARYGEILRRDTEACLAQFSEREQFAIRAACHSWLMEPAAAVVGGAALEVADADLGELGLSEPERAALVEKLRSLSVARQMLLAEWIEARRRSDG